MCYIKVLDHFNAGCEPTLILYFALFNFNLIHIQRGFLLGPWFNLAVISL